MLLVVPDVPGMPSRKPLIQGYGCRRVGNDAISCETVFVDRHVPTQTLVAQLHERHKPPITVRLDWSPLPPGLHGRVVIDITLEEPYAAEAQER